MENIETSFSPITDLVALHLLLASALATIVMADLMGKRLTSGGPMATKIKNSMVSAVVLAGGASRRMGEKNKLLAEVNGEALVRRTVETAIGSDAAEVIVVTGHQADLLREALSDFDVRFVDNPNYSEGLSTSLRAGIGAVSGNLTGALVMLGDMPWVTAGTVTALIERFHAEEDKTICRPTFEGLAGNPILWPRAFFPDILDIRGDIGAKGLIERYSGHVSKVDVDDAGIHFDIDKPDDLNSV